MEIAKTIKSAISTVTGSLSKLKEELTDTNRQIAVIGAQIEELRDMPVSIKDYGIFLRARIEKLAETHMALLEANIFRRADSRGQIPQNKIPLSKVETTPFMPEGFFSGNDGSALSVHAACFFFGDEIHAGFMQRAEAKFGKRWGNEDLPTVEERTKTIFSLEEQLVALHEKRSALETEIDEISTALRS
jgi:chaperonin cofactor prefoldin